MYSSMLSIKIYFKHPLFEAPSWWALQVVTRTRSALVFGSLASAEENLQRWIFTQLPKVSPVLKPIEASTQVAGVTEKDSRNLLWSIQTRFLETRRNLWYYGQVTVTTDTVYQIIIEGVASDGGFAVDDIGFYNGTCQSEYWILSLIFLSNCILSNIDVFLWQFVHEKRLSRSKLKSKECKAIDLMILHTWIYHKLP